MHVHDDSGCNERCEVSDWMQIGFSGRVLGLAHELMLTATVFGTDTGFNREQRVFSDV